MVRPTKKAQIPNLSEAIKEAAWRQTAQSGAAALSLRGIARELGITAPAIYHYFPRRDDLVTALIVDAFNSLGQAQRQALSDLPESDLAGRLTALGFAYRSWAVAYPQRYQLIFGTPIPGYVAPAEITVPAAAGSLAPLIETLESIFRTNKLHADRLAPMTAELAAMLEAWSEFAGGAPAEVLYSALVIWSRVHGLVSLEIGDQLPGFFTDPGEVYRREIDALRISYLEE